MSFRRIVLFLLSTNFAVSTFANDEQQLAFFETKIRPVLVKHCYECHSAKSDDIMGGLLLDTRAGSQKGGDSGPAVVPKSQEKSLLLDAISYKNPDLQMPPQGALSKEVIADFKRWIDDGAFDPRAGDIQAARHTFDLNKRKSEHWAWQPIRRSNPPTSIDQLVQEQLNEAQLTSAPQAASATLVRRLSFDLVGLPPTPQQVKDFTTEFASDPDQAIQRLVDRLLDDQRFGEHWARHWLDIVRYSETKGHVTDQERPYAWKYRDYVIHAFNIDLPYDRFVIEHIAGDLLAESEHRPGPNGEHNMAPAATGSLFFHEMHFMAVDPVGQRWNQINAQIDVASKAFMGLTVECARCHDHKFDAISQADYYALAGFFYSTEMTQHRTAPRDAKRSSQKKTIALVNDYNKFIAARRRSRKIAQTPKAGGKYFPIDDELGITSPGDTRNQLNKIAALEKADPSWGQWVRSAVDKTDGTSGGKDVPLLIRGEHRNPGELVRRRFLAAIASTNLPKTGYSGSGRLWLAQQIASPKNPLTARVWVNRLWHHLVGQGIVSTPNNFGLLGAKPSHPELLDYLANRLIANQWSTKAVIREIVLSKTYQQSSRTKLNVTVDPENKLLSHMNRRRLTAEQLRDAMLQVSGSLDGTMYGPSVDCYVAPYATANKPGNVPKTGPLDGANRRSIYIKVRRNFFDPFLKTFDFPDPGHSVGRRTITIVPSQALAMLNSPLVHELSRDWAERIVKTKSSHSDRVDAIWMSALGRFPDDDECELVRELIQDLKAGNNLRKRTETELWQNMVHVVFNHPDFAWID